MTDPKHLRHIVIFVVGDESFIEIDGVALKVQNYVNLGFRSEFDVERVANVADGGMTADEVVSDVESWCHFRIEEGDSRAKTYQSAIKALAEYRKARGVGG